MLTCGMCFDSFGRWMACHCREWASTMWPNTWRSTTPRAPSGRPWLRLAPLRLPGLASLPINWGTRRSRANGCGCRSRCSPPTISPGSWNDSTRRQRRLITRGGLRIGEVWRLNLTDVDVAPGGYVLVRRGKWGTTRRVPWDFLPDAWRQLVAEFIDARKTAITENPALLVSSSALHAVASTARFHGESDFLRRRVGHAASKMRERQAA